MHLTYLYIYIYIIYVIYIHAIEIQANGFSEVLSYVMKHAWMWKKATYIAYIAGGAPDETVQQNIYSTNIVSWLAKSTEQSMNLY